MGKLNDTISKVKKSNDELVQELQSLAFAATSLGNTILAETLYSFANTLNLNMGKIERAHLEELESSTGISLSDVFNKPKTAPTPPSSELGEQKRDFEDTHSAFGVVKKEFFDKSKRRED